MDQPQQQPNMSALYFRPVARMALRVLALPMFIVMAIGAMLLALVRFYKS